MSYASFWSDIFSILFAFASIFLIFIVLLQRGRGGGLAGAFGATGGQSAFGTKAGDVFTRITIGVAVVWVALAGVTGYAMSKESRGASKRRPLTSRSSCSRHSRTSGSARRRR